MRELPILFSAPMVRAILEGRKTVTRRVVKPQPPARNDMINAAYCGHPNLWLPNGSIGADTPREWKCPYGQPGDRLWVRETFAQWPTCDLVRGGKVGMTAYRAGKPVLVPPPGAHVPLDQWPREWRDDTKPESVRWRPSIHMPRWASRIALEVTGVRVERLQDITSDQILAEGVQIPTTPEGSALIDISTKHGPAFFLPALNGNSTDDLLRAHWAALWVAINGIDSWNANPWVWVVEFKRVQP
jgi:hypothetical protein